MFCDQRNHKVLLLSDDLRDRPLGEVVCCKPGTDESPYTPMSVYTK